MNKNHGNGHDKSAGGKRKLRSLEWFNNPHNPGMAGRRATVDFGRSGDVLQQLNMTSWSMR